MTKRDRTVYSVITMRLFDFHSVNFKNHSRGNRCVAGLELLEMKRPLQRRR